MVRNASASKKAKKEPLPAGLEIWERFLAKIRGVRSRQEIVSRTIGFLEETFHPSECFLAVPEGRQGALAVMSLCTSSNSKAHPPKPEEERHVIRRWGKSMRRVLEEGGTSMEKRGGQLSLLSSLMSPEGPQGILVLEDLASDSLDPAVKRAVECIAGELAERMAFLKGLSLPADRARRREDPDWQALNQAMEEERRRVKDLESLLVETKQAGERRAKELERMTEQLISMRTFNESVLQSLSSGLISVDRKGRINYVNRGAEKILQYSKEEILGKPLSAAMASKDKRDLLTIQDEDDELSMGRQIQMMRKDGIEIPVGFTISPHRDASGQEMGKIIHFRDLTRINEMQEELLRMDRLVSLGEISMGIAHEIRNPLTGIRITAQALEEEVTDNESLREYVFRIISEIDRLNELLKSFFSFAKPQQPRLGSCHIPELIHDVLFLVRKDLEQRRIRVEQTHSTDLPAVSVDMNQMKQALLNLFLNSVQAISEDGLIRVGTTVVSQRERREIILSISDTGKGIPLEHQTKIFNPFFTTKAKGLGLGLSITYRIISRHGGSIRVQSEPSKGTTFFVHLPLDDAKAKWTADEASPFDRG